MTQIDPFGSSFNTLLAVYPGSSVSALTAVASNDNSPNGGTTTSLVQFTAQQGTTYRIAIDGRNNAGTGASSGNYILTLQMLPTVLITAPTNGTIVLHGAAIPFTVSVSTPSPPITGVELYSSFGIIGTNSTPPFNFTVTNAP